MFACQFRQHRGLNWRDNRGWSLNRKQQGPDVVEQELRERRFCADRLLRPRTKL
jgi:hypothetical protein